MHMALKIGRKRSEGKLYMQESKKDIGENNGKSKVDDC